MIFFNQSFWQQLISGITGGLILMVIASFFGHKGGHSHVSVTSEKTGKKIKAALILFRIMFYGGLWMFLGNLSVYGFSNQYTGFGFSLAFLGLIGLLITKLTRFWSHG